MAKWHNLYEDDVEFPNGNRDCRTGKYLVYDQDTFDYLVNNMDWVMTNDAYDEHSYIIDNLDKMLESNDGELIFIPKIEVSMKIDNFYEMRHMEWELNEIPE